MIPVIGKLKYITIKVFREFLKAKNHYVATSQMPLGYAMDAICRDSMRDPCTSPGSPHSCCLQILYSVRQPLAAQRTAASNGTRNHAQRLRKLLVAGKGENRESSEEGLNGRGGAEGMWNRATLLIKTSHTSKHFTSVF